MFTDTHSHIHFTREFPDIEGILERARQARVDRQIIVGCTPRDSFEALNFIQQHKDFSMWSTLGVHPHNADEWNAEMERKFGNAVFENRGKIVALGEMGLDYFRNLQPADVQKQAFEGQLRLALKLDLPSVVHIREAWDDAFEVLQRVGNTKVILHCFTGTLAIAQMAWQRGYHLSFSGVVTYPKNDYLRQVALKTPLSQMLIETDCPYLTPQVFRGKRNEPAFVVETAKVLAALRGLSLEEFGEATTQNALALLGIS